MSLSKLGYFFSVLFTVPALFLLHHQVELVFINRYIYYYDNRPYVYSILVVLMLLINTLFAIILNKPRTRSVVIKYSLFYSLATLIGGIVISIILLIYIYNSGITFC